MEQKVRKKLKKEQQLYVISVLSSLINLEIKRTLARSCS